MQHREHQPMMTTCRSKALLVILGAPQQTPTRRLTKLPAAWAAQSRLLLCNPCLHLPPSRLAPLHVISGSEVLGLLEPNAQEGNWALSAKVHALTGANASPLATRFVYRACHI